MAGISTRTLRYYDSIGLLKPERVDGNGYSYYGEASLIRLQQILFFRELDMPLKKIHKIMGEGDFDTVLALEEHRKALEKKLERSFGLIETIDQTILHIKGEKRMEDKSLFTAFTEEEQEEYAKEAERSYDPEIVKASQKKWVSYSAEEKKRISEEGETAYRALAAAIPLGPASKEAQAGVELWRKHMDYFWTPSPEQLVGLAELYNADPRFKKNFDRIDPRLAAFMREAVKIYIEKPWESTPD